MTDKTPRSPEVDWEAIENDYRTGLTSFRQLAKAYPSTNDVPLNHVAIARKAKRENWVKDLSPKIQAEAERLVTRKAVTDGRVVTDKVVVEVNASAVAEVRMRHRDDIRKLRDLNARLLLELERDMDAKTPSPLDKRVGLLKTVTETAKTVIGLDREAWGIQNSQEGTTPQTITKIVREIVRPS